jgi:hypothetical protein
VKKISFATLSVFAFLFLVSCGSDSSTKTNSASTYPVIGSWTSGASTDGGLSVEAYIVVTSNTYSLNAKCSKGTETKTATVTASAVLTANTITSTGPAMQNVQMVGGEECKVEFSGGTGQFTYTVVGDTLTLTKQDGSSFQLTRRK